MKRIQRWLAAAACFGLATQSLMTSAPARPMLTRPVLFNPYKFVKPQTVRLSDGRRVTIDRMGFATIADAHGQITEQRVLPASVVPAGNPNSADYKQKTQALGSFLSFFRGSAHQPYAPGALLVVFKDGISPASDSITVSQSTLKQMRTAKSAAQQQSLAPRYTNDSYVNGAFAKLGVSGVKRMFASLDRSRLSSMRAVAQAAVRQPLLNIGNAYRVNVAHSSVENAIAQLRKLNSVAYAGPDWTVTTMHTQPQPVSDRQRQQLRAVDLGKLRQAARLRTESGVTQSAIPQNFSVVSSLQSLLNASGIDAIAAYDEVESAFHQMPGTGEIVTNVSVGDIYAAEDSTGNFSNICTKINQVLGPMSQMVNGQRYLNIPGLPLIPAYAADASGQIDPHYTACNEADPSEYDLDFSMMAALPDEAQRAGEQGTPSNGDILGIAPGASYRLVVPATNSGNGGAFESGIAGAFIAAASQNPKPDVITASLGYGYDAESFPGRYLEDDPLIQSLISTIVNSDNIVVCISANDGMRSFTPVSVGMYGGSAPTNVTTDPSAATQLSDVALSTSPSAVVDSGAIDVGGTTLNDIFSRPPQDPANAAYASTLAFPETRYNGSENLSSGFGSRVNISAPSDNVFALMRRLDFCATPDCEDPVSTGGTSASSPEVAAAAAVALQVARLSGHPITSARSVRDVLVQTATPVAQPQQTDIPLNVGPQLNVRRLVEQLLNNAGMTVRPSVKRVAIAQRRPSYPLDTQNTVFFTNTDPTYINLAGEDYGLGDGPDGSGVNAYITIAPDWEGMPAGTSYSLTIQGHPDKVLATTPFTRMLPATILNAAFPGTPVANSGMRTVHLTYRAASGKHMLAQANFDLTFGPTDGTSVVGFAPVVPAVVKGDSFKVQYDVNGVRHMDNPMLVVTEPGRFTTADGFVTHLTFTQPLASKSGTVTVPVAALQGAGLYGVAVMSTDPNTGSQYVTNWATTRVEQGSALRAPAPVVKVHGDIGPSYHTMETSLDASIDVTWDVSSVTGSSGALLEASAPGPTAAGILSTFNNQNGSMPDNDGFNSGSTKVIPLSGVRGTMTFSAAQLGLQNGMVQQIRVIPVSGSAATGEASDVSTIITDGILNGIGGRLDSLYTWFQGGFSINPNGNDALMFPWLGDRGTIISEAEVFDQTTHTIEPLSANYAALLNGNFGAFYATGGALFNDNALFGVSQTVGTPLGSLFDMYASLGNYQSDGTYQSLPNLAFPNPNYVVYQASSNNGSGKAALLLFDASQPYGSAPPVLMSVDTTGQSPTFTGPFPTNASMDILGSMLLFDADTNLGKALIVRQTPIDWCCGYVPVSMDVVDMNTGATTTVASQAMGVAPELAIDDSTHVAMMFSTGDDSLVTFNLQTGAQQKVPSPLASLLPGLSGLSPTFTPWYIAADPVNHLFLIAAPLDPSAVNANFNSTSLVYVVDENGNLVKTIGGLSFSGPFVTVNLRAGLQVNGHTRTGYLMAYNELQVFKY